MDNEKFEAASQAYAAKDYDAAIAAFQECLFTVQQNPGAGEIGLLNHRIGNCQLKKKDFDNAIRSYAAALEDPAYGELGSINFNLGISYAALGDYDDAVTYFQSAIDDSSYPTPYKAYSGMGKALLKLGKAAEAGAAFRSAALDEANPDPTKALLNLGICFMALDRPADAAASYESALQFDMPKPLRNKLNANLGQAYVASNQMQKAVNAFEDALADKTYFLNDPASVDYQRAIAAVSTGTIALKGAIGGADEPEISAENDPLNPANEDLDSFEPSYSTGAIDPISAEDEKFFTQSNEELEQWSRNAEAAERSNKKNKQRKGGKGKKVLITIVVIVLLLVAAAGVAYTQGYGYPSQASVVTSVFQNPDNASGQFASSVSDSDRTSMLAPVVKSDNPTIDSIQNGMNQSTAYVTTTTSQGANVNYKVTLVRDGIGWKVSDISLYFPSQS